MRPPRYSLDCPLTLTIYRSGQKRELWGRLNSWQASFFASTFFEVQSYSSPPGRGNAWAR